MRHLIRAVLILGMTLVCGASLRAADAQEILVRAKQAAGGDAWDRIRTTHSLVKISTGGLTGTGESWEDVEHGRFVDRYALGPVTGAGGFDGKVVWSQDASKQVRVEGDAEAREAAANEGYRRSLAFWFPQRWPAQVELSGERDENSRHFFIMRITPQGGRPFDLWVDAATFLFDRTVEKAAIETRTTFLSEYRTVDGFKIAFAARSTNGEERYDQFVNLEKIEFNLPVEAAQFAMPAPPPPDFAFARGAASTTVPFQLLNNHIYLEVKLDGKGPFRLLCDTGGSNIVTPELAKAIGLKTEGTLQGRGVGEKSEDVGLTKVQGIEIGDVTLRNQVFAVFPLGQFSNAEGVGVSGLVGYEVFKRFVVKVDYERSTLTLTLPSAFQDQGSGTIVPFIFKGHIPQVDGEIDGIAGKFDIDTGSRASLDLLAPFVEKNNLKARYAPKIEAVTGWGVGGASRSQITRARMLKLGGVTVESPVTELSLQKQGAFTDPYVAGNVGAGVLKRFNLTFDYTHQQIIFEKNANYAKPDVFDRAGMWTNQEGDAFVVLDVVAEGPAERAGLKPGDKILAIDGKPPKELSLPAARVKFKNDAPGTRIRLNVESGGQKREAVLVLRDLV